MYAKSRHAVGNPMPPLARNTNHHWKSIVVIECYICMHLEYVLGRKGSDGIELNELKLVGLD